MFWYFYIKIKVRNIAHVEEVYAKLTQDAQNIHCELGEAFLTAEKIIQQLTDTQNSDSSY